MYHLTRTPDAHFLTEVRYKGTKVVSVSPDYAESTTSSDAWLNVKPALMRLLLWRWVTLS